MKNFFKVASLLIIDSFLIVAMNNCKKDVAEQTTQPAIKKTSAVMTAEDSLFSKKIIWFDGIMQNYAADPNYSLNKQFSSDSALWYIEAWFNAKYAFTDEQYIKTKTGTDSLNISINPNNNVEMNDIANAYDELLTKAKSMFNQSTLNNKELILLDLEISRTGISEVVVNIKPVFGEKGVITFSGDDPFGDDDYWYYGEFKGDCDLSVYEDTDAAQKIAGAVMTNRPIYLPCPGCYYTYSDIDTVIRQGYEYQNSNDEYLIFYIVRPDGNFTPDDKCLEPDEMNFHFHGEETVIYEILEPELNKTFMSCYLEGLQDDDEDGNPRIRHHNELFFGIMHLVEPGWIIVDKEHLAN